MSEGEQEEGGETSDHKNGPSRKKFKSSLGNSSFNTTLSTDSSQEMCAVSGILEYVTVKNFMCHDHLTFPFSPSINFVQGRNGSGKSAVLTAVVVGLGGASRLTNRGNSLKELVKYGKQTATIEIAVKNDGKDAFHRDLYGDTIIVERRIIATGGGGYKLLSKNRKTVSTKKEDLVRMLDHFNMQVDNPITVLNQDMSRAFLNSTDPHNLYKFFLKATQLQQMKDDYNQLHKDLRVSNEIINDRKETLPHLEKEVEEHRAQYEFCVTLNDKRKKLSELRRELAWAMIIDLENEEANALKEIEAHTKIHKKMQTKIDNLQNKLKEQQESHKSSKENFDRILKQAKAVSNEVQAVNEKVIQAKREVKDREGIKNSIQRKMREIKKELVVLQEAVYKSNTDAQSQWSVRRSQWNEAMEETKKQQIQVQQDARTEETHRINLSNTMDVKREAVSQLNMEDKAIRRKIGGLEQELKGLRGHQNNQFTVFGQWVPQLLKEIDVAFNRGAFNKKPVGPVGAFVKVQDNRWGHVAEAVLGSRINAFCVDSSPDEQVLRKIMNGINFPRRQQPLVVVCKFRDQVHNVSRFEVQSDDYPSLWSMLNINNTVVANTVIDQMQVESILLIPTADEAGRLLKDRATVPVNCKVAYTLNRDMYYPDPNYRLYSGRGQEPARFLQVSVEQKVKSIEAEMETCKQDLQGISQAMVEARGEARKIEEELQASNRKSQAHKRSLDQLRYKLAELQNQEESPPPDMSQLEEDIKQQQTRYSEEDTQLGKIEEQIIESKAILAEISSEHAMKRKEVTDLQQEAQSISDQVSQFDSNKNDTSTSMNTLKRKFQDIEKQETELEKASKKAIENLAKQLKELEAAENFLPRIETKRRVDEVKRQYDSLEARLNKERTQSGDPVTITARYKETRQRYQKVSAEVESHFELIKEIKKSLESRNQNYKCFRKILSVMIKSSFKCHLNTRGLQGTLQFDFEKHTLTLDVTQMNSGDPSVSSGNTRSGKASKNPVPQRKLAMMSGGERSYSTVSFIIALWNVIESPIRILDEFDVFMDIVARKRAMRMMIQAAKPKTQYVYLTPLQLDASFPNIKVFRMQDPERGEKTAT